MTPVCGLNILITPRKTTRVRESHYQRGADPPEGAGDGVGGWGGGRGVGGWRGRGRWTWG